MYQCYYLLVKNNVIMKIKVKELDLESIRAYMPKGSIKKVAKDCNVSPVTVSSVLQGKFNNHNVLHKCTKIALENKKLIDKMLNNIIELNK